MVSVSRKAYFIAYLPDGTTRRLSLESDFNVIRLAPVIKLDLILFICASAVSTFIAGTGAVYQAICTRSQL